MYMNIRPRQKKDKGGWLCMPQCKNIPEGKKGWTKIKCPICGELCHENEYEINRKEVK